MSRGGGCRESVHWESLPRQGACTGKAFVKAALSQKRPLCRRCQRSTFASILSNTQSDAGKATPPSRLHIGNGHSRDEKPNRWNSCPVLNAARARAISDKIDQNYIIGFYGPLQTQPKGMLFGSERLVICLRIVTIWLDCRECFSLKNLKVRMIQVKPNIHKAGRLFTAACPHQFGSMASWR